MLDKIIAWLQFLEARVNRALAYAQGAFGATTNTHESLVAAPVGPATQVTIESLNFTPRVSGKVLVWCYVSVTDAVVDDEIQCQIIQNPTSPTGAPGGVALGLKATLASSHVGGFAYASMFVMAANLPLGTPARFGLTSQSIGANNLTATSGFFLIQELPG